MGSLKRNVRLKILRSMAFFHKQQNRIRYCSCCTLKDKEEIIWNLF